MKKQKNIKLILIILLCILLILIGFFGIYKKNNNAYTNLLPNYLLSSDFKGSTVLEFKVDNSSSKVYYDKDGKEVDSANVTEENKADYTEKEIPANAEENLTTDNYKKTLEIMKKRLSFLKADQYQIDLDKKTGEIALTIEDDYIDDVKSMLPLEGRLKLVDENTNDVILDYSDFKSAEASYASLDEGYTIYISLKLNVSGIEKINNLDKYKTIVKEDENGQIAENKLKVLFDTDSIAEVNYDDILLVGKTLRITTSENLTSNSSVQSKMNMNTIVSKLSTIGKTPVVYKLSAEEYIGTNNYNCVNYIIIGIAVICTIISLVFIFKYKINGLLATLGFATNISIFLILIRLTKVVISLNGFAGILALIILNTILVNNILKSIGENNKEVSQSIKNGYIKSIDSIVVILIVFVVFSFVGMTTINSMGLLVFWGWLAILLGNIIFTVPMLSNANKN